LPQAKDRAGLARRDERSSRGHAKYNHLIYAWDKACIDYHLWHRLKHNSGIYFITIEKVFNELKGKMEERKSWTRGYKSNAEDSPLHPLAACPYLQRGSPKRLSSSPCCGMGLLE
jgi:hypothetical protein